MQEDPFPAWLRTWPRRNSQSSSWRATYAGTGAVKLHERCSTAEPRLVRKRCGQEVPVRKGKCAPFRRPTTVAAGVQCLGRRRGFLGRFVPVPQLDGSCSRGQAKPWPRCRRVMSPRANQAALAFAGEARKLKECRFPRLRQFVEVMRFWIWDLDRLSWLLFRCGLVFDFRFAIPSAPLRQITLAFAFSDALDSRRREIGHRSPLLFRRAACEHVRVHCRSNLLVRDLVVSVANGLAQRIDLIGADG
jgi:hypothetical protein